MGRTAMKASTCSSVTAARAAWCLATSSCSTCTQRGLQASEDCSVRRQGCGRGSWVECGQHAMRDQRPSRFWREMWAVRQSAVC